MSNKIAIGAFALFLLALAAVADAPDPAKPGPFPVGVTTILFVDHGRVDPATNGPRSLMTEIWYPATDDTASLSKAGLLATYMPHPNFAVGLALKALADVDLTDVDKTFHCVAARDARVREGVFPLVVFSHGSGGIRTQNVSWCEHVASHGYIVMAPDHTGNAAFTLIDGILIPQKADSTDQASKDRPMDVRFLIGQMGRMNRGADSRFQARVDMEHVGVAGHSFGGFTATMVADMEPHLSGIIAMAGVGKTRSNFMCPALVFVASEDVTMKADGNQAMRQYYETSRGPRCLVEFLNAGHFSFTDMYQFKADFGDGIGKGRRITKDEPLTYATMDVVFPLLNGYSTAFLGRYLKGIKEYEEYLKANHNPDELIVKAEFPAGK